MPIIPLITRQQPIANAPAPVLDRNRRPTVDTSEQQRGAALVARTAQLPDVDARAFTAPYEALGSVGRAIAETGSVLGALAEKRIEAESHLQVAEADAELTRVQTDFELWKTRHPDPRGWVEQQQLMLEPLREQLLSKNGLHPRAAERINLQLTRRGSQILAQTRLEADKETFNLTKSVFLANWSEAAEAGDVNRANEAIEQANAEGYIQPHEVAHYKQQTISIQNRKKAEAEAEAYRQGEEGAVAMASTMPLDKVLEEVDGPAYAGMTAKQRAAIKQTARSVSNAKTVDEMNKLEEAIADGTIKDESQLKARAVNNPHLPKRIQEEAVRFLDRSDDEKKRKDREDNGDRNFADVFQKIMLYDKSQYKTELDAQLASLQLRREARDRVGSEDDGYLSKWIWAKATGTQPQIEPADEVRSYLYDELKNRFGPKGAIPWVKEGEDGKDIVDPAKQSEALAAMYKAKKAMNEWMKANPKDAQDIDKAREMLINKFLPEGGRSKQIDALKRIQDEAPSVRNRSAKTATPENSEMFLMERSREGATRGDAIKGLEPTMKTALARLIADAPGEVTLYSAYRSPERQQQLWNAALKKYGSADAARKWVAPPGRSNHNHGKAVDLRFANEETKKWVHENARRYGLHFPMQWEPWHIEPVGSRG